MYKSVMLNSLAGGFRRFFSRKHRVDSQHSEGVERNICSFGSPV